MLYLKWLKLTGKMLHFDGKLIQDITNNDKTKKDRFAILVNIDGETKLLGIPRHRVEMQNHMIVCLKFLGIMILLIMLEV